MSTPMTPAQWRSQLKKFHVDFVEIGNWETFGRDQATGLTFGPVHGSMQHHTGDDAPDINDRNVLTRGRPGLPAPLAHGGARDDGVIELISCHRANHAGGGDPAVFQAVLNESYDRYPPAPHYHEGSRGQFDGNDVFYGLESYYSGGHPMTVAQYRACVGWHAAICDFHGWSAKSVIGHDEWSDWKVDPGHVDMYKMRLDIEERIKNPNAGATPHFRTPNITKAIALNVAYDKQLGTITAGYAQLQVRTIRAELAKEREALKNLERR